MKVKKKGIEILLAIDHGEAFERVEKFLICFPQY